MRRVGVIGAALITASVAGCAVMPAGPMIPALPGSQKSAEAFQGDDRACRDEANGTVASMSSVYGQGAYYSLQRFYDARYLQCMYAHGNRVPADFAQEASLQQPPHGVPPYPPRDYPPPAGAPATGAPASSATPK